MIFQICENLDGGVKKSFLVNILKIEKSEILCIAPGKSDTPFCKSKLLCMKKKKKMEHQICSKGRNKRRRALFSIIESYCSSPQTWNPLFFSLFPLGKQYKAIYKVGDVGLNWVRALYRGVLNFDASIQP